MIELMPIIDTIFKAIWIYLLAWIILAFLFLWQAADEERNYDDFIERWYDRILIDERLYGND